MKKIWHDINIYEKNTVDRYGSGFPIDESGNTKTTCLNGVWKFLFCENEESVPKDYYLLDSNESGFQTINVPSNWQLQGYDIPIYTNYRYPNALESVNIAAIPKIKPEKNSAGCYVTYFDLSEKDLEDKIFINFGGINSCGLVYINGEFVGFSEDSFDEQEYNITPYVKVGKNKLCVTVYRYCVGSYLEDQDMWRLSGIFRDVLLVFKPKVEISDFFAYADVNANEKSAVFNVNAKVLIDGEPLADGLLVCELIDSEGNSVYKEEKPLSSAMLEQRINMPYQANLNDIELWSHETPYLYTLFITLFADGKFLDRRKSNFGFRSIRIVPCIDKKGPFILLNGKPLKFRGVNRHEFHPDFGHAVPIAYTEADIKLCLLNNITAIRTSHYPNSRGFYELCDRYGILVMCENNLETHGLAYFLPKGKKKWTKHCLYRINNMVKTYRNHPCIISWSLGNESGFGRAFYAMRDEVKRLDTTRFVHYEPDTSGKVSEVLSEMYAGLQKMPRIGKNMNIIHCRALWNVLGSPMPSHKYKNLPFMQCEYAHCMGNSLGNFSDYWREFKKYDRLAGGFIWDFADQALAFRHLDGTVEWRYGGDFGDQPNDGRFAFNGIFKADRSAGSALPEVRKQYQMIDFFLEENKLIFKNNYMFTPLSDFSFRLSYLVDGIEVEGFEVVPPVAKVGESVYITIDPPKDTDGELTLIVEASLKKDYKCLSAGYIVAYEQFIINPSQFALAPIKGGATHVEDKKIITVSSPRMRCVIDKKTGGIVSIVKDEVELLTSPILPNFWRAITDNDSCAVLSEKMVDAIFGVRKLKKAMKHLHPQNIKIRGAEGVIYINICWFMPYMRVLDTTYAIGESEIDMSMKVLSIREMYRYGFTFALKKGIDGMTFYAKGPKENYCDRKSGYPMKQYSGKAEDFIHDYLYPQENGNHTEGRFLDIGGEEEGISVIAKEKPFEFSVHPYTLEMLDDADHSYKLKRLDYLTVNIDGGQKGVGGDTPAFVNVKKPYRLLPNRYYHLSVRMIVK